MSLALAGGGVSGCAWNVPPALAAGSARLLLATGRQIQYVSSDIHSIKVTLTDQASGRTYVQTIASPNVQPRSGGGLFDFTAANLPADTYVAKVEAYTDNAETQLVGASISAPFSVNNSATTTVTLPTMTLRATPVGDWAITVQTTLGKGVSLTSFQTSLTQTNGTVVAGPSGNNPGTSVATFTWGNVLGAPSGISTTSVTITSVENNQSTTTTEIATISIVPGATVSSTITFSLL